MYNLPQLRTSTTQQIQSTVDHPHAADFIHSSNPDGLHLCRLNRQSQEFKCKLGNICTDPCIRRICNCTRQSQVQFILLMHGECNYLPNLHKNSSLVNHIVLKRNCYEEQSFIKRTTMEIGTSAPYLDLTTLLLSQL